MSEYGALDREITEVLTHVDNALSNATQISVEVFLAFRHELAPGKHERNAAIILARVATELAETANDRAQESAAAAATAARFETQATERRAAAWRAAQMEHSSADGHSQLARSYAQSALDYQQESKRLAQIATALCTVDIAICCESAAAMLARSQNPERI